MRAHRLRANERTEAASLWCFVDCESWPISIGGPHKKVQHKLHLGCAQFVRLAGSEVIQEQWHTFWTADEFWGWLVPHLSEHRPLWLLAHNTSFDWPLLDGYRLIEANCQSSWRLIFGPPVTILTGHINGRKLVVLDGLNYFRASIATIGDWLGRPKGQMPAWTESDEAWITYCKRDVEILSAAVLRLVALHRGQDLGVLGKTLAQSALHAYRHRLAPRQARPVAADSRAAARGKHVEHVLQLVFHGDDDLCELERACYYGGRAEARRIGTYSGPWYDLDTNSLFASVMRDTRLPCRWRDTVQDAPLDWLEAQLGLYEAAAEVTVDSATNTYPWRRWPEQPAANRGSLPPWVEEATRRSTAPLYVNGHFRTCLCGTELRHALQRGHLAACHRVALYDRAYLFREYVDYWYGRRLDGFRSGDKWSERVAKSYLTALAGVWAKHGAHWLSTDDWQPSELWGKVYCWDAIADKRRVYRAIAGVAQEEVEEGEPAGVLPIVSACITSEARERMRRLQLIAGLEHWLYEDTDSLLVDQVGFDHLSAAGCINELRIGALRCRGIAESATIWGVKDYVLDGRRVCKGVREDADWSKEPAVTQDRWTGHRAQLDSRGTAGPLQSRQTLTLRRRYTKGEVDSAGWVIPWRLGTVLQSAPF